ncbi:hypothetical protein ACODNH_23565 (plasmid) [Haloarcula sp. NS06]|uniref:hypothetical protein n=1 Tax=Haloarcula sp. NS06 TaxID=3409688 RepID=UPI003DA7624D
MNGPYVDLDELDGTNGWVQTSGFVTWVEDVANHRPYQRLRLGDQDTSEPVVCTVWTDDIALDEGAGYRLTGADATYDPYGEVQLKVGESSQIEQFYSE